MKDKNFKIIKDDLKVLGAGLLHTRNRVRTTCFINEAYDDEDSTKELIEILPHYGHVNEAFGRDWSMAIVKMKSGKDGIKAFNMLSSEEKYTSVTNNDNSIYHSLRYERDVFNGVKGELPFRIPISDNLLGSFVQIYNSTEFPVVVNERNKGIRIYNSLPGINPKFGTLTNRIVIVHVKLYTCLYRESNTIVRFSRRPAEYAKFISQAYANASNPHVNKVYADTYAFLSTIYDMHDHPKDIKIAQVPFFRELDKKNPESNSMYVISRLNIEANDLLTSPAVYIRSLDTTIAKMTDDTNIANMISPEDVDKEYGGNDKNKSLSINLKLTDSENKLPNPMYLPLLDEIIPIERSTSVDDDGLRLQLKYNNSKNVSTVKNIPLEEIAKGRYIYDNQEHAKQGADKLTVIKHETEVIKHEAEKVKIESQQLAAQQKQLASEQELKVEREKFKQNMEKLQYENHILSHKYEYDLAYSRRQTQQFEKETDLINAKNVFAVVGAVGTSAATIYALVKLYNSHRK